MLDIKQRFYRSRAEINLGAIKENLLTIKEKMPSHYGAVAVIKADAYGHGAVRVAKTIEDLVSAFAVATPTEALELAKNSVKKPIYILGYCDKEFFSDIIENEIIPTVFSYDSARELSLVAGSLGKKARISIKIDTGMSRIGFDTSEESKKEILKISSLDCIETYGCFTHFSTADEESKEFTLEQNRIFSSFVASLEDEGAHFSVVHASNSAAAMDMPYLHPESPRHRTEVRIGIALYGIYPSDYVSREIALTPAMSLKSRIVMIKEVPEGTPIGYGRSFITNRATRVATLTIGYADGYSRRLSNKGKVIVKGKLAPIIGNICMDMCMIDVTDIEDASLLDEVTLMGSDMEYTVSADDIANIVGTIPYEIIASVGKRVPRVYVNVPTDKESSLT